jgi:hypothetical protein
MSDASPPPETRGSLHAANWQGLRETLQASGAPARDAVGWHYIELLAQRAHSTPPGALQALLEEKLGKALQDFSKRIAAQASTASALARQQQPSPLATLLQEMTPAPAQTGPDSPQLGGWQPVSPRVQQFRKQLRKIDARKKVRHAIAQAPQNAGPINSHMLVLRALGLMRDISPDYLDRFMGHVDSLLRLEGARSARTTSAKSAGGHKTSR